MAEAEVFTPAPKNVFLQSIFVLFFVGPQVCLYFSNDYGRDVEQIGEWSVHTLRLSAWQQWLHSPAFLLVLAALSVERIIYTLVWLFPAHFMHAVERTPLRYAGSPVEAVVTLFYVSKVFQFGSLFGWYLWVADPPRPADVSVLRWVTGAQLVLVGQLLNIAIYRAIGKAGVYYGYKLGASVPWCTGFPFNVFTMHPQYAGCVMTILGGGLLMATPKHVEEGWFGLGVAATLYYCYMMVVEDIPCEHPLDQGRQAGRTDVRLRELRSLRWSTPGSRDWHTSQNLVALSARPWFPALVAVSGVANCFLMVLSMPLSIAFSLFCAREPGSVVSAALTAAGGLTFGTAALVWARESGTLAGVLLSSQQLAESWPRTVEQVGRHGWWGTVAAGMFVHPMPVVSAGMAAGSSGVGLVVATSISGFLYFVGLGLVSVVLRSLLGAVSDYLYCDFGLPSRQPSVTAVRAKKE
eukprot:TRINITY_DN33246_c0_g1_i1.p1 TRINITY_DN33246_c0_g1~~TRINITY_DN33246_c0_g1_i1.p1  ORF type:complete len:481 (+),score=135.60 TRINITY_DN33246_c0_g1_i1:51-1445(+)